MKTENSFCIAGIKEGYSLGSTGMLLVALSELLGKPCLQLVGSVRSAYWKRWGFSLKWTHEKAYFIIYSEGKAYILCKGTAEELIIRFDELMEETGKILQASTITSFSDFKNLEHIFMLRFFPLCDFYTKRNIDRVAREPFD